MCGSNFYGSDVIWEKAILILAGNLNWGLSYLITTVIGDQNKMNTKKTKEFSSNPWVALRVDPEAHGW